MNIIIEGPDGAGKTTAARMLAAALNMPYVRFPGSTPAGEYLRPLLKGEKGELDPLTLGMLFAVADMDLNLDINRRNKDGEYVVCDRSGLSGIVYRLAAGDIRGAQYLQKYINMIESALFPDGQNVLIILYADDDILDARMGARANDSDEGTKHRSEVRRIYRNTMTDINVFAINTSKITIDEVVSRIKFCVESSQNGKTVTNAEFMHFIDLIVSYEHDRILSGK